MFVLSGQRLAFVGYVMVVVVRLTFAFVQLSYSAVVVAVVVVVVVVVEEE